MRIAFIVDAHSPIAINWISYFVERGHDVHVLSTYPCAPGTLPGAQVTQAPIAFTGLLKNGDNNQAEPKRRRALLGSIVRRLRKDATLSKRLLAVRDSLASLEIYRHIKTIHDRIAAISPDIVHAMRIPFEGIAAAKAVGPEFPLVISVWGNDFTLFAGRDPIINWQTKKALRRADALHCDCLRDARLAQVWGFKSYKPITVLPGAGGVQSQFFYPGLPDGALRDNLEISANTPVVINPRGFRSYVCNDAFFQAIPLVLRERPETIFLSNSMQNNRAAQTWVERLGIAQNIRLLPSIPREEMADLFRLAQVTVSPSLHDGTPNTLLEAMACGCFPVAGNIESLREWISDGSNGLLCDPRSPEALARVILRALNDNEMRQRAKEQNLKLIAERADYAVVMTCAEKYYRQVIDQFHSDSCSSN